MEKTILAIGLLGFGTLTAAFILAAALLHSNDEMSAESFDDWKRKELEES